MELLPGQLTWAPERLDRSKKGQFSAFDFCGDAGSSYQVQHYTVKGQGRAFGPLGLRQTLEFCRGLRKHMVSSSRSASEIVELSTPRNDPEAHTNAAVLVGAYLILNAGFSVQDVRKAMGDTEAKRKFACSWAREDRPEAPRNMEVADCWLGLELARQKRWLPSDILFHDPAYFAWLTVYNRMLMSYDATWIVPGSLIVCADPTTTAYDPNPVTCSNVFPPSCTVDSKSEEVPGVPLTSPYYNAVDYDANTSETRTPSGEGRESEPSPSGSEGKEYEAEVEEAADETASTDTVCKAYTGSKDLARKGSKDTVPVYAFPSDTEGFGLDASGRPKPFAHFLQQDCKVGLVLRTNSPNEPGMTVPYDGKAMLDYDIVHQDIIIDDHHGGMPGRLAIQDALEASREYMKMDECADVVLVHCKGGFGRSVVLASCLLIEHYDVPGRALLGWIRLARPGAVTTQQQEQFLRAQRGREDLDRFVGKNRAQPSCGCTLM